MNKIALYCNWHVKPVDNGFYISSLEAKYLHEFYEFSDSDEIYLLSGIDDGQISDDEIFIPFDQVKLVGIPNLNTYFSAYRNFFKIYSGVRFLLLNCNFIYIRTPEPFSWLFGIFKKKSQKLVYHFTSDPIDLIKVKYRDMPLKKVFVLLIFLLEYYFICISAFFNKSTCNGNSIKKNIPFFLRDKTKILIESTLPKYKEPYCRSRYDNNITSFLCVSRLMHSKGLEQLIEAFSFLTKKYDNIVLNIVGDGPLKSVLQNKIDSLKLNDSIFLLGFVPNGGDLDLVYQKNEIFINPSLSETGPRVLIEAMSFSLFCISTDVGYSKYVMSFKDECFGRIIAPNDIVSLANEMENAHLNKNDFLDLANRGAKRASNFTLNNFVSDIVNYLD